VKTFNKSSSGKHYSERSEIPIILFSLFFLFMDSNIISAIAWVSKGYALRVPKEYEFEELDVQEMKKDPIVSKKYCILIILVCAVI